MGPQIVRLFAKNSTSRRFSVNRLDTGDIKATARENGIGGINVKTQVEEERPMGEDVKICQITSGELAVLEVAKQRRRSA